MTSDWSRHLPDGEDLPELVTPDESLTAVWSAHWQAAPERVALVDLTTRRERALDRRTLDDGSARAAALLRSKGVGTGDRVLLSGAARLSYLLLYVGALRLGAVIVPANTGYTAPELAHIVDDSGAGIAVIDEPERVAGTGLRVIRPTDVALGEWSPDTRGLDLARAADTAMIAYTSGTTGRPKGATLSHGNLLASARAVAVAWRWTENDGLVLALPLFHLHGLGVGVHGSLVAGARILLLPGFTADGVARAAARDDATMFFGVPTMHKRLAELAEIDVDAAAALASLRLVVSGSAPLAEELWHRIRELTGQRVLERYGMTETIMNVSNPYEGGRRPGTVGLPLPGVEVRLAGDAPDGVGEIELRGPNVFAGYHGRDDATAEAFTDDGWFRTGDIGRRDADGYYAIVGRAKELIISGGYNIYPREVEEALETHDRVAEAAVVGRPSDEWGERVVAFVVPANAADPPTNEELTAFVSARLASFKRPREFHYVDALPRNALGKVERRRVAGLVADRAD